MTDVHNRPPGTGGREDRAGQGEPVRVLRRDLDSLPTPWPRTEPLDDRVLVPGRAVEAPRTRPGEQLAEVFEEAVDAHPDSVAVDTGDDALSYRDLDARADRLAHHLHERGTGPGDVVGLLLDDPVEAYTALLAVLKAGATFVPLDTGFPADRIRYVLDDSSAGLLLATSDALDTVGDAIGDEVEVLRVAGRDSAAAEIARRPAERLDTDVRRDGRDHPAYLIYTSGSTGRPKGVVISHPAICNFVRVAADCYGVRPDDRMYQGLTLAFDFSVEEIWTTFLTGATLVPKPAGVSLVGEDLHDFLARHRVTALCCVPTLLATLDADLDDLRFLLVSGEACPQDLVRRWHADGRRFLNVYGPTEATVTATWTALHPDRPVTIGEPLPTYAVLVLDPEDPGTVLPFGETGEIAIAGIGLADGYLGRADKTAAAFVESPVDLPGVPSGLVYRTGDLGRVDDRGEIEYRGRIDLQVKVRGYRIELSEIEAVLLDHPSVAMAVVDTREVGGTTELVGWFSVAGGAEPPGDLRERLRERLPGYMVPAYLEHLDRIPMTTSDKADRKALPDPTGSRVTGTGPVVPPESDVERGLVDELAAVLDADPSEISVTAHLFDELGATSMLVAGFAAAVRRRADLPPVAAREVYRNPTVRDLAAALGTGAAPDAGPVTVEPVRARPIAHALTGLAQLAVLLAGGFAAAAVLTSGYGWVSAAPDPAGLVARSGALAAAVLAGLALLPVVAKWTIVGRFRPGRIPLWGIAHLRFWVVTTLIRASPVVALRGTPVYTGWLRLLGARIGRGSVLAGGVPVAVDLVRVGDRSLVHPEASLQGYRAVPGALELGTVEIGDGCIVGEAGVLDVWSGLEDGAQLGHASALRAGATVPAGEVWHGSPAGPSDSDYATVEPVGAGRLRRVGYGTALIVLLWLAASAVVAAVVAAYARFGPQVAASAGPAAGGPWWLLGIGALAVMALVVLGIGIGVLAVLVLPRLASLLVPADRTFPLYGVRHVAQQIVTGVSNARLLVLLLGDSSFVTSYLKGLGYDLGEVHQTGSNFGTQLRQEAPRHSVVGRGTMVSDGLRMMNTDLSHDSFRVRRVGLGRDNFVGNDVHLPPDARTGDDVLLATKVMVPTDGPVRSGVGLLGSPPMEIPRSGAGPHPNRPATEDERRGRLRAKNRHNATTLLLTVLLRAVGAALALLPLGLSAVWWPSWGLWGLGLALVLGPALAMVWAALLERATLGFRPLRPRTASIYDRYFWFHERLWKLYVRPVLAGSPLLVWRNRLAGLTAGRRVFDDGCALPEKTLTTVGDDAVLNAGSVVQCHSLEDGRFESGRADVGDGAALGVRVFVHHSTAVGDGATLAADSFLMKGEQVGLGERWGGNPAGPEPEIAPVPDHRADAR